MKKIIGIVLLLFVAGCQTQEDMIKGCADFCGSRDNIQSILGDIYGHLSCVCKDGTHIFR